MTAARSAEKRVGEMVETMAETKVVSTAGSTVEMKAALTAALRGDQMALTWVD